VGRAEELDCAKATDAKASIPERNSNGRSERIKPSRSFDRSSSADLQTRR
jgi:hypothetical protein